MSDHYDADWAANMERKYKKAQLVQLVKRAFLMFEDLRDYYAKTADVSEVADAFENMMKEVDGD